MDFSRVIDRVLEGGKRLQRAYYRGQYEELAQRLRWLRVQDPPFAQASFPLAHADQIKTILIFKPDDIGDCVYALPALAELRKAFPNAKLSLICQRICAPLFERTGLFDRVAAIDVKIRWRRFPSFDLQKTLREMGVAQFDLAIFLRTYPAYFSQFLQIPAKIKLHPHDPRLKSDSQHRAYVELWGDIRAHQTLQMLQIVAPLTGRHYAAGDAQFPPFHWTAEDRKALEIAFPKAIPPQFIVIHPYAKDETRRYPSEYWAKILERVRQQFAGAPIVVIGGKEDLPIPELGGVVNLQGKLSLAQTGFLTSQAKTFLGVSSGPAHLAAALGIPTIILSGGVSDPSEWGPIGDNLLLRAEVPCAPCHSRSCLGFGLVCLTKLTPDRVLPEIERFLGQVNLKSSGDDYETDTSTMIDPSRPLRLENLGLNLPIKS